MKKIIILTLLVLCVGVVWAQEGEDVNLNLEEEFGFDAGEVVSAAKDSLTISTGAEMPVVIGIDADTSIYIDNEEASPSKISSGDEVSIDYVVIEGEKVATWIDVVKKEKPVEAPEEQPEAFEEQPETPEEQSEVSEEQPETPGEESETPEEKPEAPEEEPEVSEEEPEAPEEKPEEPEEKPVEEEAEAAAEEGSN